MSTRVVIVDPDPFWPRVFAELCERIMPAFAGTPVRIEHIGSTAVPGLAAKPIIDLVVVVPTVDDIPDAIARLMTLGYEHEGDLGIPGREAFRSPAPEPAHHLYLSAADSPSLAAQLHFRDALRADPTLAAEYAALKQRLAMIHGADRAAYTAGKTDFIVTVTGDAVGR